MINTSTMANNLNHTAETQFSTPVMEVAAKNVDRSMSIDCSAPRLIDLMNINQHSGSTASGLIDHDYPSMNGMHVALSNMSQIKNISTIPLPTEIVDNFSHVQCHSMMGLFPEISRGWLTVDSDIYIWTYEENSDLAYFDGINETILCVGLVRPKPGVFHAFIKHLLVLATAVDIIVLGVTFSEGTKGQAEIHLIPDPVFTLPTDGNTVTTFAGTTTGRLFFGTKEGTLFEISYQAESGWFGKRCKLVNLSTSALSFLVPSFLNAALSEEDSINQIVIDNTRNILYTLTEKGAIEVCDLCEKGDGFSRVTKVSQSSLVNQAMNTVKTLDSQNFRPIVSISPIEASESANLNLVAVTQTGVRFYLSVVGLSNQMSNQRPYTLTLFHVRLPPGFSANATVRPRNVHMSHYRDRSLILISNKPEENDVLWCLSSDLFPYSSTLMEAYSTIKLEGPALAVAEVRHNDYLYLSPDQEAPPLIVRQHIEPPKKYIVLTTNCIKIYIKLRPVDVLKQILNDSRVQDSPALKAFFSVLNDSQGCATSLILASLDNPENAEIAELATRAFFMFGGEPQVVQMTMNQSNVFSGTTLFNPNIISTPAQQSPFSPQPPGAVSPFQTQNNPFSPQGQANATYPQHLQNSFAQPSAFDRNSIVNFSAKHNGMYLYLCRILRPIWNRNCVEKVCSDGKTILSDSTISSEECQKILNDLNALHNFLIRNTQLCSSHSLQKIQMQLQTTQYNPPGLKSFTQQPGSSLIPQDGQLEERQSLDALKTFVCHCCQIMGLWRVLCDHQIHELIGTLPQNQQDVLQSIAFRELFLYKQEICSMLINALVNTYLGDNASVDAISNKLMEICPHLYRAEDAALSKANELLIATRAVQNNDEKDDMIVQALQLCKNIAPNVNLPEMCRQFTALKAYKAVLELCVDCGKKMDPEKIAESYFNTDDNMGDRDGFAIYQKRMEIYREIVALLDHLYDQQEPTSIQEDPDYSYPKSVVMEGVDPTKLNAAMNKIIQEILLYDDEIMHVALYDWMVSKNMTGDLIKISKSSLENYLKRCSIQNPDNIRVMDLLWKYYETHGEHAKAARILDTLASIRGTNISLKERLAYLARAIMCMRSSKNGSIPNLGVFLGNLEDKLEVAKVQELILEEITNLKNQIPNANEAIAALNSGLYEITQLYENFTEPFNLLECQLAIIYCARYSDNNHLIKSIWKQILANELKKSSGSGSDRMTQILSKVKHLVRTYSQSDSTILPFDYIISELEMASAKLKADPHLIPTAMVSADVPISKLVDVYNNIVIASSHMEFWHGDDHEFHLCEAAASLIDSFINSQDTFTSVIKRRVTSSCQDIVSTLLSNLYTRPNSDSLVLSLRNIQARLSRV